MSMKDSAIHGDQYVTVQIQVPQNLSPEAKEKLREFQQVLYKDDTEEEEEVQHNKHFLFCVRRKQKNFLIFILSLCKEMVNFL